MLQQALLDPLHRNGKLYGPASSHQAKRQCHTSQEHHYLLSGGRCWPRTRQANVSGRF